jgi:hypothetical protein
MLHPRLLGSLMHQLTAVRFLSQTIIDVRACF